MKVNLTTQSTMLKIYFEGVAILKLDKDKMLKQVNDYFKNITEDQLIKDIVETGSASYFEDEELLLKRYKEIVELENK